jgi:hypothetical protein
MRSAATASQQSRRFEAELNRQKDRSLYRALAALSFKAAV